ncbi:MAG: phytanoyl-CoA dioxygenase, partial [Chitinophagaceae bacterium]|nr:phytanoyl-CoA dioxygenase [Chitinophagaceae bacterium]
MKKWDSEFQLGDLVTPEQIEFFDEHGVILFRNFLTPEQVKLFISEVSRIEQMWLEEKREKVNGIPLKFGKDEHGNTTIQRLCFSSLFSEPLH